jgi:TonB-dependent SusC/RagA subfamily outer membrane receptor
MKATSFFSNILLYLLLGGSAALLGACASMQPGDTRASDVQTTMEMNELSNPANNVRVDGTTPLDLTVADMLRRVSGITVRGGDANTKVFIRGINSINSGLEPLFVVDGVEVGSTYQSVAHLNANVIRSVTVLKDSDAAIYGTRGANGVVLIRTRQE